MQHLSVHWSEGLFLTAQHFQAAERHWADLLAHSERFDHSYNYGLHKLRFSDAAISNFSFQLDACEGRSRRGTKISLGEGEEPGRATLKDGLDAATGKPAGAQLKQDLEDLRKAKGVVRVYLGIPKMRLGTANTGRRGDAGLQRYVEVPGASLQDENAGGNDQEVGFRALNFRLIVKSPRATAEGGPPQFDDDDPDWELLPIAQVRAGDMGPELDKTYIPPVLACDAWAELQQGIVQTIYDWIGNRIEILSQQVLIRRITLASSEPGDLDRILMLMMLNRAYVTLGHLAFAMGVHPFVAYGALLEIVGQLSIFDPTRRPPADIPRYDHDDLGRIFLWVMNRLKSLLALQPDIYFYRPFEGRGLGMQVTFEPEWLGEGFKWFVGVHYEGLSAVNCRALLAPNHLHWKLGSARQVEGLFSSGRTGLILTPQENAPKELPAQNYLYFEVSRSGDAWQDVVSTQTLAMRYKDSLVDNRASLEGQRTLVINIPPKKVQLQFSLFSVPTRT